MNQTEYLFQQKLEKEGYKVIRIEITRGNFSNLNTSRRRGMPDFFVKKDTDEFYLELKSGYFGFSLVQLERICELCRLGKRVVLAIIEKRYENIEKSYETKDIVKIVEGEITNDKNDEILIYHFYNITIEDKIIKFEEIQLW